ncbi:MAG: hypothetical protein GY816_11780, partial [Cytophagales bacterium]|nr:hypothetical protein [Cytophagales bacterium]
MITTSRDIATGKRGSVEIGSILLKFLRTLPESVKNVTMISDSCGGQNRNRIVAAAMHYAVQNLPLESITLAFLETGHTMMPVDSMHSVIERAVRNKRLYTVSDWEREIKGACRTKPYETNLWKWGDFLDLKSLADEEAPNTKLDVDGKKVLWRKIRMIRFLEDKPKSWFYSESFDRDEFKEILVRAQQTRGRKSKQDLAPVYSGRLPIADKKKSDLIALVNAGIVPEEVSDFYTSLPTASTALDECRIDHED